MNPGSVREAYAECLRAQDLNPPDWRPMSTSLRMPVLMQGLGRLALYPPRLPAVLKGDDQPRDAAETLIFAFICYDQGRYAASARLSAAGSWPPIPSSASIL